jgi:hypothetical protein
VSCPLPWKIFLNEINGAIWFELGCPSSNLLKEVGALDEPAPDKGADLRLVTRRFDLPRPKNAAELNG